MSSNPALQIALVTGASRGIGRAIALALGQRPNTYIIGTATSRMGAQSITDFLKEAEIPGEGLVLDITDLAQIETFVAHLKNTHQSPHLLINNAGVTCDNLFIRMRPEEWSKVIQTNLSGTYHLTQACIRSMIKQRFGRIVNISSVVGLTGNAGQANYSAAKAGLIGLTKSIALEVGSRNVTANVIAPGFIETDMTHVLSETQQQKLLEQIPLGRIGKPEEIAQVVCFLVSEQANYITGATIHVNGGLYMV